MALLLSACASRMPNTASYEISSKSYTPEDLIVVKGNASECKRIYGQIVLNKTFGSFKNMVFKPEEHLSCAFLPEGTVPREIQIEYGELLSKDHENKENIEIYNKQAINDYDVTKNWCVLRKQEVLTW